VVVCLVALGIYVQKKPGAVTDLLMERIRDRYASDVTPEDKAALESAYSEFRTALEAGRVRREDLDRVRYTIKLGREVPRDEVLELTRVFREAAEEGAGSREAPPRATPPPVEATPVP
jgi:hypothetical protein